MEPGVVSSAAVGPLGSPTSVHTVPSSPGLKPAARSRCWASIAIVVLPLVPVTPTIRRCRAGSPKNASAKRPARGWSISSSLTATSSDARSHKVRSAASRSQAEVDSTSPPTPRSMASPMNPGDRSVQGPRARNNPPAWAFRLSSVSAVQTASRPFAPATMRSATPLRSSSNRTTGATEGRMGGSGVPGMQTDLSGAGGRRCVGVRIRPPGPAREGSAWHPTPHHPTGCYRPARLNRCNAPPVRPGSESRPWHASIDP